MAKFSTTIPTEAEAFIKTLSKTSTVEGVVLNPDTKHVQVLWEDESLFTGLTVPVEFPINMHRANKLPPKTYKASERSKAPAPLPKKENPVEAKPEAKTTPPSYLSEKELNDLVAKGTPIEQYGVHPKWIPFNPKLDHFTEGFFYRKKVVEQTKAVA